MNAPAVISSAPSEHPANSRIAYPWMPDRGDGTYCNPIIHADYSDPDVIRHGNDFYLTASSFNCTPGLPILHSHDLVNWTLVNHALKNLPGEQYREVQPGCGVWAPAIRFHAGKFWIYFSTPDEGIFVITASHPASQWSKPHLVQAGKGLIDPCPLWDDDGSAYLIHAYAHSRSGNKHVLRVCPMAGNGSRLLDNGKIIFHDPERHPTVEGPKFLKKDGWYYILAPAGGVETGWQIALRSRNIYGPYESKIVLEQGGTPINGPHQGALLDAPGGDWWFVHFQDAGVYGRVVHLQPVQWQDGWPLMGAIQNGGEICEPVLHFQKPVAGKTSTAVVPLTSDEFNSPKLGLQWQWQANHEEGWCSLTERPGSLRLFPQPRTHADLGKTPALLLQKFPARSFTVETALEFAPQNAGEEAGLIVAGRIHAALALRRSERGSQIIFRTQEATNVLTENFGNSAMFRVTVNEAGWCQFSFAGKNGGGTAIAEKFLAQRGIWIGAKVGLYAIKSGHGKSGHADFDYFRFFPTEDSDGVRVGPRALQEKPYPSCAD